MSRIHALFLILCVGSAASVAAQGPGSGGPQDPVGQAIEQALGSSPEIRLAEAKVREAEANLALARMKVIEEVLRRQHEKRTRDLELESALTDLQEVEALHETGNLSADRLRLAQLAVRRLEVERSLAKTYDALVASAWFAGPGLVTFDDFGAPTPGGNPASSPDSEGSEVERELAVRVRFAGSDGETIRTAVERLLEGTNLRLIGIDREVEQSDMPTRNGGRELYGKQATQPMEGTRETIFAALADQFGVFFVVRPYGVLVRVAGLKKQYEGSRLIPRPARSGAGR